MICVQLPAPRKIQSEHQRRLSKELSPCPGGSRSSSGSLQQPQYSSSVSARGTDSPRSFSACTFSFSDSCLACCSTRCSSRISSMDTCCRGVSLSFSRSCRRNNPSALHSALEHSAPHKGWG